MTSRRPPSDTFTRFTSSQPHAMSRPSASNTSAFSASHLTTDPKPFPSPASSTSQPGPPGETPQEKVARLRAAARLARERGSTSAVDRFLISGRRIADTTHRIFTYTLIAFTGVSTVVAVYGVTSLIAHNRRQKRAWIEREMDRLHNAQQAFLRGEATAEQLHLLEQERAGEEMALAHKREKERKKSESYWGQLKGMVGATAATGEMGQETAEERQTREARRARNAAARQRLNDESFVEGEVTAIAAAPSGIKGVGVDSKGRPVPEGRVEYVTRKVGDERRTGEKEVTARTGITGGPLDMLAENATNAATSEGKGWLTWLRGGGKS